MKKVISVAMLMIAMTTFAQQTPTPSGEKSKMESLTPEQKQQLHLKKLTLDLNLNASQQKEFEALLKESHLKRETAKAQRKAQKEKGQKLTKDERFALHSKMLDEKIAMKTKVRKILTPEQFEKWEKNQQSREKSFKHGRKSHKERPEKKQ